MLRFIPYLGLTCILLSAGCSKYGKMVTVHGKVTIDGKPYPGAIVHFTPAGANGLRTLPKGRSDDSGIYVLSTEDTAGVPLGEYTVFVQYEAPKGTPPPFNPRYLSANTSPLRVTVSENPAPEAYDLEL